MCLKISVCFLFVYTTSFSAIERNIKFFYNPELNETITVRPDGKISLQLVDEIQAAGLQPSELDAMLTQKYGRELKKPAITIIVRSFTGQRIYIGGEVNSQQELILQSKMTILQAVFNPQISQITQITIRPIILLMLPYQTSPAKRRGVHFGQGHAEKK